MDKGMNLHLDGIFADNTTYNYDDYEFVDQTKSECSGHLEAVFLPLLYSVALVVGLLGNGLLLVVLALSRRRQSWSVTDTLILHLAVADSLLLFTLPFWAAQAIQGQGWSFGIPFCKISGAIFNINFYCGIFLLASISLDRYLSIIHKIQIYSHRKSWLVHIGCLSVFSLLLTIPDFISLDVVKNGNKGKMVCVQDYPLESQSAPGWRLGSRLLYHLVGFLLPSAVLLFCYSCILLHLQRVSLGPQRQRAIRVILALVVVFFLCWTPYNITLMVDTFQRKKATKEPADGLCRTSLENSLMVTHALGCFHACLNPLLYLGLCRNFRKRVLDMLRCLKGTLADSKSSLWELGVVEEALPGQAHEKVVFNQVKTVENAAQPEQMSGNKTPTGDS
ncbi:C-X-C chemokine receptor type 3-like [Myripristis murdjan]|uniref:C-X-C motif chemokine receptor 3 n=1 Tax=Myripristis murdjan TaxID=586833 RepID=A0A668AEF2_9TELE|nr:C-X-C chemokine receptor type 3-like [Myripristis murdjan]